MRGAVRSADLQREEAAVKSPPLMNLQVRHAVHRPRPPVHNRRPLPPRSKLRPLRGPTSRHVSPATGDRMVFNEKLRRSYLGRASRRRLIASEAAAELTAAIKPHLEQK